MKKLVRIIWGAKMKRNKKRGRYRQTWILGICLLERKEKTWTEANKLARVVQIYTWIAIDLCPTPLYDNRDFFIIYLIKERLRL